MEAKEMGATEMGKFYMVVSSKGGHIHASTNCSTNRPTTVYTEVEDAATEQEAVAKYGAILCTFCFPTAPAEWTNGNKGNDDDYCNGEADLATGVRSNTNWKSGSARCRSCGKWVTINWMTGKARKHKAEGK